MKSLRFFPTLFFLNFLLIVNVRPTSAQSLRVDGNKPRVYSFTDRKHAYYYGSSHGDAFNDWFAGWNRATKRLFHDYSLFADGKALKRSESEVVVYPDHIERKWAEGRESFQMLDEQDVLVVEALDWKTDNISIRLEGDLCKMRELVDPGLVYDLKEAPDMMLLVAPIRETQLNQESDRLSCASRCGGFLIVCGRSLPELKQLVRAVRGNLSQLKKQRAERIAHAFAYTRTPKNPGVGEALSWIHSTGDALITQQQGWGIYAGLPWFNDYWGRDLFISLPGLCLVNGQFSIAKSILTSFAAFQNQNEKSSDYGRVPNRARPDDIIYNTADGTPRFVIALGEYWKYSGDSSLIRTLFPAVVRATEGSIRYHTDKSGFLTHADADTWMDAKEDGKRPFSPRGNRANDLQALWYAQLTQAADMAEWMGEKAMAKRWLGLASKVQTAFRAQFIHPKTFAMADRLTATGKADFSIRPNAFYALDLMEEGSARRKLVRGLWEHLVYPWGVGSLEQSDSNFHPFHENWKFYHKDAAYHNGTVWLWNNGIAMQRLLEYGQTDMAWTLFQNMNRLAMERGAVGSLPENSDAHPEKEGADIRLTGTFLQAWSNAEHLRVWYQHFMGIQPDMRKREIRIQPMLPDSMREVEVEVPLGEGILHLKKQSGAWELQWEGEAVAVYFQLPGYTQLQRKLQKGERWTLASADMQSIKASEQELAIRKEFEGIQFCTPKKYKYWKYLKKRYIQK